MKIQHIFYDFRKQPLLGSVSIIGTALALLLIMTVNTVYEIDYAPIAPESNRDRLLYDRSMCIENENTQACSGLSLLAIDRLYRPLTIPEEMAVVTPWYDPTDVSAATDSEPLIADLRQADDGLWRIYDYTFIDGTPFTAEEVEAKRPVAVITESVARSVFNTTEASGRTILISQKPYTVRGVVRNVSPIMGWSYAQIWIPVNGTKTASIDYESDNALNEFMGEYGVILMAPRSEDLEAMRREAHSMNATLNNELKAHGWSRHNTGSPYSQKELGQVKGSNNPPDMESYHIVKFVLLGIFLIIPAINLSSMTQSRLRRRRHEIGVRRAFGATKTAVFWSIIMENFIVTLLGGIIGLILSMIMIWTCADLLFDIKGWEGVNAPMEISSAMLFRWNTFAWAILFCFILNLLSAGIPALHASRVNPVDAINGND